jgi:hypothetical protein
MMKRHRQLNESLEMTSEVAVARSFAPDVFERLMGVEEVGGVEQSQALRERFFVHDF